MSPSREPTSSAWLGVLAFAGTFLLVPLWDIYALITTLRAGWLARRLALLGAACALAMAALAWLAGPPIEPAIQQAAPTLRLIAIAWPAGGLLTLALVGVALAVRRLGGLRRLMAGGLWLGSGILATPVGAVVLVGLLLGLRYELLAPLRLLLGGGFAAALLPALIAARAGLRAWDGAGREALPPGERIARLGLGAARAFAEQAGWLLGSLVLVEMVLGLGGLGGLLHAALLRADGAALAGALALFPPALLVARVRAALIESVERACCPPAAAPEQKQAGRLPALRLALAAGLLVAALAVPAWAWRSMPTGADSPDPAAIYAPRSAERPLGSDHLGRDARALVAEAQRATWIIALSAGVVAASFGGAWGIAANAARRWRGRTGELLAGVIRLPADAAILLRPALIGWLVAVAGGSLMSARFPLLGAGAALGLLLAPRLAWALGGHAARSSGPAAGRWLSLIAATFAMTTFAALQASLAGGLLAGGLSPALLPGAGLIPYQEVIASARLAPDGRFVWLAIFAAAPGALAAMAAYLFQDALAGRFAPRCGGALPRLFG